MFKLTESSDRVRTLSEVSVEGHETIPANATVPKGHRLWATYEAWLAQGNTPEPYETATERLNRLTNEVRSKRDQLIEQTDYLLKSDYPISPSRLEIVKEYRQDLRDITKQTGFPDDVVWPVKPDEVTT